MKKDYSKYFLILLVVFALELAAVISLRAGQSEVFTPDAPLKTDDCGNLPDDGKGLAACADSKTHGHDHSAHQDDYEPTHNLAAMALEACTGGLAGGTYPCHNVDLLAFMPLSSIGGGQGNDIWGWTDPQTGKEYALMGRTNGTAFVDVSDPVNPIYLGNLPTQTTSSSWRDIKVYQNHAYIVADSAGSHGMQIFNLTQLRNVTSPPVTFANTAHYSGFGSAHNIIINEATGFAYAVGISSGGTTCSGGLHMINIQNPTSPAFGGCYSGDGYTHDAQCVVYTGPDVEHQGKEICFNSNEDTLTIVDVTSKASPVQLSRTGYAGSEYSHQGWLTENQRYFILDDELDEQRNGHFTHSYIWDAVDLDNPAVIGTYVSGNPAIDHNMYVKDFHVYQANYRSGLRILDITNIGSGSMTEVAYFDVYPSSDSASFNGSWSNYPYFDSGVVIVSGIEQGLFVLQPNLGGPVATYTPTPPPPPTNTPTPLPPGLVFFDDFESDQGWVTNPNSNDTATSGQWEVGDPEETSSGIVLQLGTAVSGVNDLVTGRLAGTSAGSHDVDGGVTTVRSPNIILPASGDITLSFSHYLAHLNNATADDFLRVKVVGATTTTVLEELGDAADDAAVWASFNTSLNSYAGQTIHLLIEAADGAGGSLVEAAVDDVSITAGDPPTPTNTPVPPTATNTPAAASSMHVGDLDGSSTINGGRWDAQVLITIHNGSENPVANATVSGSWSEGASGNGSCVTNGSGQCTITASNLKNNVSQATFTVNNVTHASNTYQSGSNHDPDGDSNGTTIVVLRDGSPSPTPAPTNTPVPGATIHAGDLDGSSTPANGNRWDATVTITIHNSSHSPVANATVSGAWSAGANGSDSCVTNASGQCAITKNNIRNSATVTFTVSDVALSGNTYDAGANHDPDGDSNGTVIVIAQP